MSFSETFLASNKARLILMGGPRVYNEWNRVIYTNSNITISSQTSAPSFNRSIECNSGWTNPDRMAIAIIHYHTINTSFVNDACIKISVGHAEFDE